MRYKVEDRLKHEMKYEMGYKKQGTPKAGMAIRYSLFLLSIWQPYMAVAFCYFYS